VRFGVIGPEHEQALVQAGRLGKLVLLLAANGLREQFAGRIATRRAMFGCGAALFSIHPLSFRARAGSAMAV
jgi:hypothetical protein